MKISKQNWCDKMWCSTPCRMTFDNWQLKCQTIWDCVLDREIEMVKSATKMKI